MSDRICIILLNWNGKADTIECLDSLSQLDYKKLSTIVVDNGSTDGSVEVIRSAHPHTPIFETHENLGFAGGNNVGIQWALSKPFQWIFLLNNDTVVAPGILRAFMAEAERHPDAKIFGAKLLNYQDRGTIDHLGGKWDPERVEFESLGHGLPDERFRDSERVDYVCGAGMLVHRSVFETIGLLEPKFFLFWEETDFCFRARRKGFLVRTAPEARVWHKVSASFTGGKPHTHYFWWRSRLLWMERNLAPSERQHLMRTVVRPELLKELRHYLLKTGQSFFSRLLGKPVDAKKLKRLKAGLAGIRDYYLGKFGNCPKWVVRK
jgi:GT2 family glycosyltransferase